MTVYYFDEPTIGYCGECGSIAVYHGSYGLVCPENKDHVISLFTWDESSRHPEDDSEDEEEY